MDTNHKEYLSLKVLRLTKPYFTMDNSLLLEEEDIGYSSFYTEKRINHRLEGPVTEMLNLPTSFGNIYLGETFTSYVTVINDSNQVCRDVVIKAHIQTSTQQLALTGSSAVGAATSVTEMEPGSSLDDIIAHEVKELGSHVLICSVSYLVGPTLDKCFFKKFYKFQVSKPLDVKTKFHPDGDNCVYMEAQIQNITNGMIFLERVSLEPTSFYTVDEIDCSAEETLGESTFGRINCLRCNNTRQYLYCLTPQAAQPEDGLSEPTPLGPITGQNPSTSLQIGRLDIVWRTAMGEKGRLQTSTLSKPVSTPYVTSFTGLKVSLLELPSSGVVGQLVHIRCRLENVSECNVDLVACLTNYPRSGLSWTGCLRRGLGYLSPGTGLDLPLYLMPVCPGLHVVAGLKLTDTLSRKEYEQTELGQILIMNA